MIGMQLARLLSHELRSRRHGEKISGFTRAVGSVAALKAVCSECPKEHNAQAYYCVVELGAIKSITCARVESYQLV